MDTPLGLSGRAAAPRCARGTFPQRGSGAPGGHDPPSRTYLSRAAGQAQARSEASSSRSGARTRSISRTHLAPLGRWAGPGRGLFCADHAHQWAGPLGGPPPPWVSGAQAPPRAGEAAPLPQRPAPPTRADRRGAAVVRTTFNAATRRGSAAPPRPSGTGSPGSAPPPSGARGGSRSRSLRRRPAGNPRAERLVLGRPGRAPDAPNANPSSRPEGVRLGLGLRGKATLHWGPPH